jgi:hypothetical protein
MQNNNTRNKKSVFIDSSEQKSKKTEQSRKQTAVQYQCMKKKQNKSTMENDLP